MIDMGRPVLLLISRLIWSIFILVFFASAVLFRGRTKKKSKRGFDLFLLIVLITSPSWFIVAAYIGKYSENIFIEVTGIVLMFMGLAGYLSALAYLRSNWSILTEIKEDHELIMEGPYKVVRHPMYFFMILVIFGSGLVLSNYVILILALFAGIIYYYRAKDEEEMLRKEFPEYDSYSKRTKMMIPGIF